MRRKMIATVAFGLVACGGGSGTNPSPTPSAPTTASRPSSTATIKILVPEKGATFAENDVPVRLELTGGKIVPQVSNKLTPNEGHVHLKLDGVTITILGTLHETLEDVSAGPHLLEVEFVAVDHGKFNPPVTDTTTFTVQ